MGKRPRKRYTDDFRTNAVLMLEAAGYPDKEGALTEVGNHLGVPLSTIRGWFTAERNPPPAELRNEKRAELKDLLRNEIDAIFSEMHRARPDATYRDLGWVGAVLFDKLQLLNNQPTAIFKLQQAIEQGVVTPDEARQRWPNLAEQLFKEAGIDVSSG